MPRPKGSRNKTEAPSKRGDIQAAAIKVFCHYGYDGATLELIASAARVSRALVGKYYGSKEKLATLCIRGFIQGFFVTFHKAHEKAATYHEATGTLANLFPLHRPSGAFSSPCCAPQALPTCTPKLYPAPLPAPLPRSWPLPLA